MYKKLYKFICLLYFCFTQKERQGVGGALVSINEVNVHRARLLLAWVTVGQVHAQ